MKPLFCCPVCQLPLLEAGNGTSLVCPKRHCFDRAAEGYYHLLPSHKMHTKLPGDNKEMVMARRQFLQAGYYQLFSDGINHAAERLFEHAAPVIFDAGCGEGYYTGRIFRHLQGKGLLPTVAGIDISKPAIKAAAKQDRERKVQYAVASIFALPVPERSCDLVLNIFAPIVPQEFRRVLKNGGYLLLAVPGERHLFGLKEVLYDAPYENEKTETSYPGFSFVERIPLRDRITIDDPQQIQNLFSMTPYYWKTPAAGAERLRHQKSLTTEIGFDLLLYRADS